MAKLSVLVIGTLALQAALAIPITWQQHSDRLQGLWRKIDEVGDDAATFVQKIQLDSVQGRHSLTSQAVEYAHNLENTVYILQQLITQMQTTRQTQGLHVLDQVARRLSEIAFSVQQTVDADPNELKNQLKQNVHNAVTEARRLVQLVQQMQQLWGPIGLHKQRELPEWQQPQWKQDPWKLNQWKQDQWDQDQRKQDKWDQDQWEKDQRNQDQRKHDQWKQNQWDEDQWKQNQWQQQQRQLQHRQVQDQWNQDQWKQDQWKQNQWDEDQWQQNQWQQQQRQLQHRQVQPLNQQKQWSQWGDDEQQEQEKHQPQWVIQRLHPEWTMQHQPQWIIQLHQPQWVQRQTPAQCKGSKINITNRVLEVLNHLLGAIQRFQIQGLMKDRSQQQIIGHIRATTNQITNALAAITSDDQETTMWLARRSQHLAHHIDQAIDKLWRRAHNQEGLVWNTIKRTINTLSEIRSELEQAALARWSRDSHRGTSELKKVLKTSIFSLENQIEKLVELSQTSNRTGADAEIATNLVRSVLADLLSALKQLERQLELIAHRTHDY